MAFVQFLYKPVLLEETVHPLALIVSQLRPAHTDFVEPAENQIYNPTLYRHKIHLPMCLNHVRVACGAKIGDVISQLCQIADNARIFNGLNRDKIDVYERDVLKFINLYIAEYEMKPFKTYQDLQRVVFEEFTPGRAPAHLHETEAERLERRPYAEEVDEAIWLLQFLDKDERTRVMAALSSQVQPKRTKGCARIDFAHENHNVFWGLQQYLETKEWYTEKHLETNAMRNKPGEKYICIMEQKKDEFEIDL